VLGISLAAGAAHAQESPAENAPPVAGAAAAAPTAAAEADTIIVTGSRIARPDLQASSPVAVLSGEALKTTNTITVEQILSANPQFAAGFGGSSNNPGDGASTVNLRGLEEKRTLVLIDGKRAPFYDTDGAVDVSTIPVALIKRIDILTGGASTVYGSDAVAGVVNFILDDRFEGFSADSSYQISSRGDAALFDASLTAGFNLGDRGNIVVSGGYAKRKPVFFGARKRNSVALDSDDLVSSGGSGNTIPTAFDVPGGPGDGLQVQPDGSLSPDVQRYNFNPVNYAQLPFERYSVMALARYELTDGIEFYGRGSYARVKVATNLASTATAGFPFNIDPSNPFLSAAERSAFFDTGLNPGLQINDGSLVGTDPTARAGTSVIGIRRRVVETGGRLSNYDTKNFQVQGGLRGDLSDSLHWDFSAQYGQSKKHTVLRNDLSYTALQQALDVVAGPGGVAQCFDQSNGCVPLNLFGTAPLTQDALAFVLRNALEDTKTTQFIVSGNLAGDLTFLQSPWADKPAAFSIGAEYRREKGSTLVDANYASGDLIFYGQGQNIVGKYDVKEVYTELKIPIVSDKPGIYALNLEGGFRYSDYSTVSSVYTYKYGGDYSPVEGVRFRGIYQRAVRAPNINELFSPVVAGTGSLETDPCSGTVSAAVKAICIAQGAPASAFDGLTSNIPDPISGQINIFTGGNVNLSEEKADTYTVGVVVNPTFARAFAFSLDYYNIKIKDAISETSPFVTLNQCYVIDLDPTSPACAGIVRNGQVGSLSGLTSVGVPSQLGNIAQISTEGLDVTASYRGGASEGFHYSLSFAGNYIFSYKQGSVECAGTFGGACNLEPMPEWKHVVDVNLGFQGVNFNTRWRYLGRVKQDSATSILKSRIPGFSYIDETVSMEVSDAFTLRLGILNVFDKKSPIVGDTVGTDASGGSTYPNTYDVIGRQFFAGATVKF
jgi:outer membrane receptor protein involved in Fe transport